MWFDNIVLENQEDKFILDLDQPNDIEKDYIIKWSPFLCIWVTHQIFKYIYNFLPGPVAKYKCDKMQMILTYMTHIINSGP